MRKAAANKVLVLGIDGMDPRLTRKYLDEGKMPNTQKFIDMGAQRHDLVMLGGHPTVTPPMWTTLATGCYANVHGITCFNRQGNDLDKMDYNLDSRLCKAEQMWNVTAEAGLKTLVFHWPGSSWPPSSDSPNLHVVDGTQPACVNMSVATIDDEFVLIADVKTEAITYKEKAAADSNVPCVINDLEEVVARDSRDHYAKADNTNIILDQKDGTNCYSKAPFDLAYSTIKPATGWANAPEDAKEITLLCSKGLLRRVALILKNEDGIYDRIAIYKSKKETEPIVVLKNDEFTTDIVDEAISRKDRVTRRPVSRNMRILELAEDVTHVKMWVSAGMDTESDIMWSPKYLYKKVTDAIGHCHPFCMIGGVDRALLWKCMIPNWDAKAEWYADALHYLMKEENYDVIFSHFHNIDLQGHMIVRRMKDHGDNKLPESEYAALMERVYEQTDNYIGRFLHLVDEGWTVFIVSDHGQVCPEHQPPYLGDDAGVNLRVMEELGYTHIKYDENGNELHEIDWERTKAVANRGNHIYINLKGRDPHGIVEPEDKYQLEEEIMTALYGYHDKETGMRVVACALRNKDAVLLGMGGPECGDIIYWTAEGYNYDHCDSLSTTEGYANTSVSPIFMAAGKGLKSGVETERVIRQVDLIPTIASLLGLRMPKQCEGAPIYQIFEEEY